MPDQITQVYEWCADKIHTMAVQNLLIMNLLRIITPEEIADIATKHNGGKFLSLTDLVNERVERNIYRDFSRTDSVDEIHEEHAQQAIEDSAHAKILPFNKKEISVSNEEIPFVEESEEGARPKFVAQAITTSQVVPRFQEREVEEVVKVEHAEGENMSSFILIEKARLKQSQKNLKQKEVINLYQKNSNIDVEQIKSTNKNPGTSNESGVLVNKKHY